MDGPEEVGTWLFIGCETKLLNMTGLYCGEVGTPVAPAGKAELKGLPGVTRACLKSFQGKDLSISCRSLGPGAIHVSSAAFNAWSLVGGGGRQLCGKEMREAGN